MNAQLRFMCGLHGPGKKAVPLEWVFTRFFKKFMKYEEEIKQIFENLVDE